MSNSIKCGSKSYVCQVDERPFYIIKKRIKAQKKLIKNTRTYSKNKHQWKDEI